ncbi:MAG TPA: hypothetical protein VGI40_12750 [Pirellulaceae bacterium]|jgi:hypothetical protein
MGRSPAEIAATAREIYDRAKISHTPLSVLSQENRNLSRESGWELEDVERVTEQVMEMLIRHGWKRQPDRSDD